MKQRRRRYSKPSKHIRRLAVAVVVVIAEGVVAGVGMEAVELVRRAALLRSTVRTHNNRIRFHLLLLLLPRYNQPLHYIKTILSRLLPTNTWTMMTFHPISTMRQQVDSTRTLRLRVTLTQLTLRLPTTLLPLLDVSLP